MKSTLEKNASASAFSSLVVGGIVLASVVTSSATVSSIQTIPDSIFSGAISRDSATAGTVAVGRSLQPGLGNSTSAGTQGQTSGTFTFSYTGSATTANSIGMKSDTSTTDTQVFYPGTGSLNSRLGAKAAELPYIRNFALLLDSSSGTSVSLDNITLTFANGTIWSDLTGNAITSSNGTDTMWLIPADWLAGGFTLTGDYAFTGTSKAAFSIYAVTPEPATACFGGALVLGLGAMELRRRRNKA